MPDLFEVIVGTYEQYLLGYKVNNIVNEYKMEKTFATHSHSSSIRSVASNKYYLASGGADDSVYLYDLRHRVESGRLIHHNDTINCIAFTPEASHLFSCSNDGTIAAVRCGNWQLEKHWQKPHKGLAVNTLAIHPTGKIALSTGADGILRTWNLVKGRQAYAINLVPRLKLDAKNVNVLKWSPNGEKYLMAVNQKIDVYSVELAGIDTEIEFDSKIVCVEFLQDDLIAVGLENGQIKFYDLEKSVQTVEAIAHDIRVKCMAFKKDLLVTACSSGEIKLWKYSKHKLNMIKKVNCGARITCLSLAMLYENLVFDNKLSKEEQKIQKKEKFSFRQEVIIENESDLDETITNNNNNNNASQLLKKKLKKKRSIEEVQNPNIPNRKKNKSIVKKKKAENDVIFEFTPKKKSKLSNNNDNCNYIDDKNKKKETFSSKKKKKRLISLEENNNVTSKKTNCELTEKILKRDNITFNQSKKKSIKSKENDEVPVKKRKKEIIVKDNGTNLKKRKKKQ